MAAEPLVFQQGAAATAFKVAVVGWLGFEGVMAVRQRLRVGARLPRDPTALVVTACIAGAFVAAVRIGRNGPAPWPGGQVWPVVAGIALIVLGVALRAWSIATLGRFFQYHIEVQPGHRVVTEGPYRYVRHPSYSGLALILAGFALATGDVLSLVAVAVLGGVGLVVRIHAEERQLSDALGPEYERFAERRKRLVPGVW